MSPISPLTGKAPSGWLQQATPSSNMWRPKTASGLSGRPKGWRVTASMPRHRHRFTIMSCCSSPTEASPSSTSVVTRSATTTALPVSPWLRSTRKPSMSVGKVRCSWVVSTAWCRSMSVTSTRNPNLMSSASPIFSSTARKYLRATGAASSTRRSLSRRSLCCRTASACSASSSTHLII